MVERYSHVMHITSNVVGDVTDGMGALEVLKATLPAGTLSGAPKIRAMEIIDELEPVKRGIYGGAVGYIGWSGNMDTAIAIRTAVIKDGMLHVQAGAGVVADSVPELEWEETMNKARALMRAAAMVCPAPEGELSLRCRTYHSGRTHQCPSLVHGLFPFQFRNRIGHYACTSLHMQHAVFNHSGTNGNRGIHIATPADIANSSAIDSALNRF